MKVLTNIKPIDLEKERSEKKRSIDDFIVSYNKNLPADFPHATLSASLEFKRLHPSFFKGNSSWSLEHHRKKYMDWLPQYIKSIS